MAQIAASIREFGWCNPVLIDGAGGIIAGHGRVLAARKLGLVDVPCIRLSHLTETQKRAYILADNKLALNAGWDDELLKLELEALKLDGIDLAILGFDAKELSEIVTTKTSEVDAEPQVDRADELRQKWGVERGQLWQLGDHRLLCGDSTVAEDVARVMGEDHADVLWTDPPYGVNNVGGTKDPTRKTYRSGGVVHNDDATGDDLVAMVGTAISRMTGGENVVAYVCSPGGENLKDMIRAFESEGLTFKHTLVWVKNAFVFGRSDYHYQHEIVLYGWRGSHKWTGPRNISTVFDFDRGDKSIPHPTSKPVGLVTSTLGNHPGEVVVEPFSGSGTTLIACEQLGRKCRAIEIDPGYVAVALQRWADATGKTPVLLP